MMDVVHIFDLVNYVFFAVILILIIGTWTFLVPIASHINDISQTAGTLANQQHISHQLDMILGNITAANHVLNPKPH